MCVNVHRCCATFHDNRHELRVARRGIAHRARSQGELGLGRAHAMLLVVPLVITAVPVALFAAAVVARVLTRLAGETTPYAVAPATSVARGVPASSVAIIASSIIVVVAVPPMMVNRTREALVAVMRPILTVNDAEPPWMAVGDNPGAFRRDFMDGEVDDDPVLQPTPSECQLTAGEPAA